MKFQVRAFNQEGANSCPICGGAVDALGFLGVLRLLALPLSAALLACCAEVGLLLVSLIRLTIACSLFVFEIDTCEQMQTP